MFLALIAQAFLQARCALAQLMTVRIFAVQKTQRIAVEAALAILAQLVEVRLEESLQLFSVLRTTFGAAYGIDFQLQILQAQTLQYLHSQQNDFRIDIRTGYAQSFYTELVELTQTACLRTVITEHRSDVIELRGSVILAQLMLNVSADSTGGVFRTQGNAAVAAVGKGIHFLFNNVGGITDTALEQLCMLKHRSSDFFVAILCANFAHGFFQITPCVNVGRHNILRTSGCCCQHSLSSPNGTHAYYRSVPSILNKSRRRSASSCRRAPYTATFFGIFSLCRWCPSGKGTLLADAGPTPITG